MATRIGFRGNGLSSLPLTALCRSTKRRADHRRSRDSLRSTVFIFRFVPSSDTDESGVMRTCCPLTIIRHPALEPATPGSLDHHEQNKMLRQDKRNHDSANLHIQKRRTVPFFFSSSSASAFSGTRTERNCMTHFLSFLILRSLSLSRSFSSFEYQRVWLFLFPHSLCPDGTCMVGVLALLHSIGSVCVLIWMDDMQSLPHG